MLMKFTKLVFRGLGLAACAGLLVTVVSQAESVKKSDASGINAASVETAAKGKIENNQEVFERYGSTLVIAKKIKKLLFSHKTHVIGLGLGCDSCHPDIFKKKRGAAKLAGDFNMKSLEQGKYCGTCHDDDTAFGVTDKKDCVTCHGSNMQQPEKIVWEKPNKAAFSHTAHVEDIGLGCSDCHDKIFSMKIGAAEADNDFNMAAFKEGQYCGTCHNGDDAFDSQSQCDSCHFAPKGKILFTQPVRAVVFDHKIHVGKAKLLCETCHKEVFVMRKGAIADQKLVLSDDSAAKRKHLEQLHERFCGTCHNSSQAFGFQTRCTVCHIGVKGLARMKGEGTKNSAHGKNGH
jgi:c(7)-type cytochrome triheme protein